MLVVRDWKQNQAAGLYLQCPERSSHSFYHEVDPMLLRACLVMLAIGLEFGSAAAQHTTAGSNAKAAPATTLTEQDNGRDIDFTAGDMLIVRLPSNPSTGYGWTVAGEPAPLKLQKSTFHKKASNGKAVGATGTSVFQLTATSSGIANLTLVYRRSWEYNSPPLKTFAVRVNVR
jgi:inhibitor of cysteine peptidase